MRRQVYLNGEWDFMPVYPGTDPQEMVKDYIWEEQKILVPSSFRWKINRINSYEPYDIFLYPDHWNDAGSGIFGRTFAVCPEADQRIFLIFKGVLQSWKVFINDICILESQEAFLPVETDITDHISREQENSIKVWCGPFKEIDTPVGKKQTAPSGSWFGQDSMGIWQDVLIEYRNCAFLRDPVVRTSFRKNLLEAEVSATAGESVYFSVFDSGRKVKEFEGILYEEANGMFVYRGSVSRDDMILWMPDDPHMYTLRAELRSDSRSGTTSAGDLLDSLDTSFGFREVWFDGFKLYLNGIRINLRGDAWHYQGFVYQTKEYALNWYKLCKEAGINSVRLHAMPYPDFFLEAADESGMLIIDESAIYGSSKKMQADDEEFLSNCRSHLARLIIRDRNHPSVIIWSMQNEMRWVDGRDGYRNEMKGLTAIIKALDPTRPVSFDGDNRLVDQEDMEIVSMHYNIDGTVAGWDKGKPIAFGEHGKWHYISPQVSCSLVGGKAYESIDSCLINIAREEALFIEYARKEDVTSICPFNTSYYMMDPMPAEDVLLSWKSPEGPGVKPKLIRKYSLTVNNGLLKDYPVYRPNVSHKLISDAFRPAVIIADEYDTNFFGYRPLIRSFSIYNDTYAKQHVQLDYRLKGTSGRIYEHGSKSFEQYPGEKESIRLEFILPVCAAKDISSPEIYTLELDLIHDERKVFSLQKQYRIFPVSSLNACDVMHKRILFIGDPIDHDALKGCTGAVMYKGELSENILSDTDILIIGRNHYGNIRSIQPLLEKYVISGGFLFIMEQDHDVPGELMLSGKKFPNATISDLMHPIFYGLTDEDFSNWSAVNVNTPDSYRPVINAFEKSVNGDVKVLLECGDGDFGCGGSLWAAMLEYRIGKGRVILQQFDMTGRINDLPQVMLLLRNIINYASCVHDTCNNSPYCDLIVADPDNITASMIPQLRKFVTDGGKLFVKAMDISNKDMIESLIERRIGLIDNEIYQVRSVHTKLCEGITAFDSCHFENVTYSPANKRNTVIAKTAISISGLEEVLVSINTPWEDMFVNDLADEKIKQATIHMWKNRSFEELCYCGYLPSGKGGIMFSQLDNAQDNNKLKRIYNRLLSNMGAEIKTDLFTYSKEEKDFSIGMFMALRYEPHNNYEEEEAYFSDSSYVLNHLGEGVYGWMTRVEKKNGFISIEGSAGKTYFLTLFINSEINRDPQKRMAGELPDSSIVPDLLLTANCGIKLFVNGKLIFHDPGSGELNDHKIEDTVLDKGLNRFTVACFGGSSDILFNCCFINKYGDFINDLKYDLTID